MTRRVVVTGVGMVTPLHPTTEGSWEALVAGQSGVGYVSRYELGEDFPVRIAAEVKGFDPLLYIDKKDLRKMDLFIQYAVAAAEQALEMARYRVRPEEADRVAVVIGSGIGGFPMIEEMHKTLLEKGPRRIWPAFIPAVIVNMAAGVISIRTGAKGPNVAPCTACSTGAHAIGDAFKLIQRGTADVAIAGGAEAAITPLAIAGFAAMHALSTRNDAPEKASRPFDAQRDGFVMGEGAGILILESLEHALDRGADILCEVVGYGLNSDAYHITAPCADGDGAIRVMRMALQDARMAPEEVDYINAHGTSTPLNDKIETLAIKAVFGEHARRLAISSTKSMMGHLLGAAGGVEAAVCVLAIRHGVIPPTINYEYPDPECDLDYVPNQARRQPVRVAMTNSFGFGGTNACLIFKRYED
jgi:3-oxoacyl-[acyl-carrier-protein] synthase II